MAAEIALKNPPVAGAIEHRAPGFQLADAVGRLLRVQFDHPPVIDVLATAHRIGKVHLPIVAFVHVCQGRRHAAFGHHRMRLSEERLANQADL